MIDWRIERRSVTGSTNDDVSHAASAGAAEGLVITADQQINGRGRQGRVWQSPVGNLYASILLRPQQPVSAYGQFSFVMALAVYDALQPLLTTQDLRLKWPNDILLEGKKICGILLEAAPHGLIIGFGLNLRHPPENPAYPAAALIDYCDTVPRPAEMLDCVLDSLNVWLDRFNQSGFQGVRAAWLDKAQRGTLTVRLPHEEIAAEFRDLDIGGCLIIRLADGSERSISSGDVFFTRQGR